MDESYLARSDRDKWHGIRTFVLRTEPVSRPVDVLAELRVARSAINRAVAALEKAGVG